MQQLKFKYGIIAAVILLAASSCQKVINIKLKEAPNQIVIEGNFTDQYGPQIVTITQSVPFTNTNTFPMVSGATVTVTDSLGHTYGFNESQPGIYISFPVRGVYGRTYTLTVKNGANVYTAQSTMPYPVPLDSLSAKIDAIGKSNDRTILVNYRDPPGVPNQYRFVLFVNGGQVGDIFAFDDNLKDGRYVSQELFQRSVDILANDTATVEMQCIDKNIYKYWFSLSQQQGNGPGGATTPSNPPSNLSNNALGYFSAHTEEEKSIIVY